MTGIRLPDKEYRTPRAVVVAEREGLALAVTVRRLKKGGGTLEVTMPLAADGTPGVRPPYPVSLRAVCCEAEGAQAMRVWLSCWLPLMVQVAEPPASPPLIDR